MDTFTLDTGATAWLLMSASLVLMMTTPALALFYGGMVRSRTVLNMMLMSFTALAVGAIVWTLCGYSIAFGSDLGGILGNPLDFAGLHGADTDSLLAGSGVPFLVAAGFQLTFAVISAALVSGAIADRVKLSAWIVFVALWIPLCYAPLAHMVWGGGLLSGSADSIAAMLLGTTGSGADAAATVAPIDFAGGTVVHINAGVAGLVLALVVGPRLGFGREVMKPHNLPLVMLGAALLWFGWFGFNAGSAGTADETAGLAWVTTVVATAGALLGWVLVEKLRHGAVTSLGAASGVVAGLVAITPAAAAVSPLGAIALGFATGAVCSLAIGLKTRFGIDDSLDVVGVHLVGGLMGTLLIGLLATDTGLLYGHGAAQLIVQIVIAVAAMIFSGTVSLLIALLLKVTLGWRISAEEERAGIDITRHAESGYDLVGSLASRLERRPAPPTGPVAESDADAATNAATNAATDSVAAPGAAPTAVATGPGDDSDRLSATTAGETR